MTTIGDPSGKLSASVPEELRHHEEKISLLITSIASQSLAFSPEITNDSPEKAASATLMTNLTKTAAKITRTAAGAGITTGLSPFTKRMVYQPPSDTAAPIIHDARTYEVDCIPGIHLGASVDSDVRDLAVKDIPLPLPFDEKAFEAAKTAMEDVLDDAFEKYVFQKVTHALQHITFSDLVNGLRTIIPVFNEAIGVNPFSAVVIPGKSNEWVTQIALQEGLKIPDKLSVREAESDCSTPAYYENVVIIDDGSYSGEQISLIMLTLCKPPKKIANKYPPVRKFFVLVPFITNEAKEMLLKTAAKKSVEINIFSSSHMPTFDETLTKEEVACFKKLAYRPGSTRFGPTLAFTDWRRPDQYSAPTDFLNGEMYYTSADGTAKSYKGPALVPAIIGPYKMREV